MKKNRWLLIALLSLIWLTIWPMKAKAVPPIPANYFGTVKVNGANVPDGTRVSAWIGGVKYAESSTLTYQGESQYSLTVPGDDPFTTGQKEGGLPGETIVFRIGELTADQTATWQEAAVEWINLTATDTTVPTATPTPSATATHTVTPTATPTATVEGSPPPATSTPTSSPTTTPTSAVTETPTATPTQTRTPTPRTPTPTPPPQTVLITQVEDTYLDKDLHDRNYGREGTVWMKTSPDGGTERRPIFKFNLLSSIPAGSYVTSATFRLRTQPSGSSTTPQSVGVYSIKRPWVANEATWDLASTGVRWASGGADDTNVDRGNVAYDTKVVADPSYALYSWDVTLLAREWALDPTSNHGLMLLGSSTALVYHRFCAAEWVQADYRPQLIVTYLPAAAVTPTATGSPGATPATPTPTATVIATASSKVLTALKDSFLDGYSPTRNYGKDYLRLKDPSKRPLIQFDLSSIPTFARVTEAKLWLYAYTRYNYSGKVLASFYLLKRPWEELQVTWREAASGESWGEPGANDPVRDREATAITQLLLDDIGKWYVWDVTAGVQRWVSNPAANYGGVLIGSQQGTEFLLLNREYTVSADLRPRLEVSYEVVPPTPAPTSTPTVTQTPTPTSTATPTVTGTATATPSTGTIAGIVWEDVNGDSIRQEGEPPLPGALITLRNEEQQEIANYRTREDGRFRFPNLRPSYEVGYYTVIEQDPPGYKSTTDNIFSAYVTANFTTTIEFGDQALFTATPTASATPTVTPSATLTWTPTVTPSPTPTSTATPTLTATPTETPTTTATPTGTLTATPTGTPTATPTQRPTVTYPYHSYLPAILAMTAR